MELLNKTELRVAADAVLEIERRQRDNKLLFYRPCCRVHRFECPIWTCGDSRHLKFHQSDAKVRIVLGGNRSGKTTMGLVEILLMACFDKHPFRKTTNPRMGRYRIYAPDFAVIDKMYLDKIREWIPRESLAEKGKTKEEAFENSYDPKYHILRLKNATIDFMSYDQDASKSASVELDGIAADEEMPEMVFNEAMARLVSRNGKFWMTVTPLYHMGWALRLLDQTDPQIEIFNFEIYDNPYTGEREIEDLKRIATTEEEREARLYGRFMELQGLFYKELKPDVHFIQPDSKPNSYPVVFCIDPHPRKPSACVWAYVTPKDDVVFFDEMEIGGTARDIAHAIRTRETTHKGKTMLRLIDPAAKKQGDFGFETDTLREFEKEGMGFTLADNSEAGYNVVHEYLSFNPALPISAFNRPKCFFTREVTKTWYGMTHLMWDEWAFRNSMRDKKETVKDYKKDFPDAVRYVLSYRPRYRALNTMYSNVGVPLGNYQTRFAHAV